jgi:hypothetical protein
MRETPEALYYLQNVIEKSIQRAGPFLQGAFHMPDHSFSAVQLANYFQGIFIGAFGTVSGLGEPRVAPVSFFLFRGHFYIPTVQTTIRARHVLKRPAVSLAHYDGIDLALIVHGKAQAVGEGHRDFHDLEDTHRAYSPNHSSVRDWGMGIFLKIEAQTIFSFARYPDLFPAEGPFPGLTTARLHAAVQAAQPTTPGGIWPAQSPPMDSAAPGYIQPS